MKLRVFSNTPIPALIFYVKLSVLSNAPISGTDFVLLSIAPIAALIMCVKLSVLSNTPTQQVHEHEAASILGR
jgi:hypothetical protein